MTFTHKANEISKVPKMEVAIRLLQHRYAGLLSMRLIKPLGRSLPHRYKAITVIASRPEVTNAQGTGSSDLKTTAHNCSLQKINEQLSHEQQYSHADNVLEHTANEYDELWTNFVTVQLRLGVWQNSVSLDETSASNSEAEMELIRLIAAQLKEHVQVLNGSHLVSIGQQLARSDKIEQEFIHSWPLLVLLQLPAIPDNTAARKVGQNLMHFCRDMRDRPSYLMACVHYINLLISQGMAQHQEEILEICKMFESDQTFFNSAACRQLSEDLVLTTQWSVFTNIMCHFDDIWTRSLYRTLIETALNLGHLERALVFIRELSGDKQPPNFLYEWIFKGDCPSDVGFNFLALREKQNWMLPSKRTAELVRDWFDKQSKPWWKTTFTESISIKEGENGPIGPSCRLCGSPINPIEPLKEDELSHLCTALTQRTLNPDNCRTEPEEFELFRNFLLEQGSVDVVIDGLNVALKRVGKISVPVPMYLLIVLEEVLAQSDRPIKVLIIGRKHMLKMDPDILAEIHSKASFFYTESSTYDDPFMLHAAMQSGPHTKLISNDKLRDHFTKLSPAEAVLLARWQHTRQIHHMLMADSNLPCLRSVSEMLDPYHRAWHIPFQSENPNTHLCALLFHPVVNCGKLGHFTYKLKLHTVTPKT